MIHGPDVYYMYMKHVSLAMCAHGWNGRAKLEHALKGRIHGMVGQRAVLKFQIQKKPEFNTKNTDTSLAPKLHAYLHAYIRTYVRTYIHTCTHTCISTQTKDGCSNFKYKTRNCKHAYIHSYIHTHTHSLTYTHTCIHKCILCIHVCM
jgi:hypothetical protein